MTETWITSVDPSEALTLTIGWRSGQKLKLRKIPVSEEVASEFRSIVGDAIEDVQGREQIAWSPEADYSPEIYLSMPNELLGEAPVLAAEHDGKSLASCLASAEGIPDATPSEVPAASIELYVVTIGNVPGERTSFLRRSNPRRGLRAGKLLTSYHDVLARIDGPVLGFDSVVDLVLTPTETHVLAPSAFQALFRDQEALLAQVPRWSSELASHIPFSSDAVERLNAKALRDRRISNRLETIVNRGHLEGVTIGTLKSTMHSVGLDPDQFFNGADELDLMEEQVPTLLYFLNEDLFFGAITNDGFRADKKAVR